METSVRKWTAATPGGAPRAFTPSMVLLALTVLLAVVVTAAAGKGAVAIAPMEIARMALHALGIGSREGFTEQQWAVFTTLRVPRVILAVLTGAGLAMAGAVTQGMFRNPLADPSLIGVSSGAALAATSAIVLGTTPTLHVLAPLRPVLVPVAAFAGGLLAVLFVRRVASREGRTSLPAMLLAGIAITALAEAGIGFFASISTDEQLRNITFWRLGSLGAASWPMLAIIVPAVLIGLIPLTRLSHALDAFTLGERQAVHIGVDAQRVKNRAIVCCALVVGAIVSVTGIIWFIGLLAPHTVRLICGPGHRLLLPASALLGATLVTVADLMARTLVAPAELPIGVLTAFIGVPLFLMLLRQRQSWIV